MLCCNQSVSMFYEVDSPGLLLIPMDSTIFSAAAIHAFPPSPKFVLAAYILVQHIVKNKQLA